MVIDSPDSKHRQSMGDRGRLRAELVTGIFLGIGIADFLDKTIFHQILQWHNFYWDTTQSGRILSDGLFHLFRTSLLLWGTLRLWRGRNESGETNRYAVIAGILMGAGGFNFCQVPHA